MTYIHIIEKVNSQILKNKKIDEILYTYIYDIFNYYYRTNNKELR